VISEKHSEVQLQVQKLASNLLHQQRHKHTSMTADSKGDNSYMDDGIDDSRQVDLDISVAVAVTEPDISQLMEDLETMAREKVRLYVCLCVCLRVCLHVCLRVCLCICLHVCLCICLCICLLTLTLLCLSLRRIC
jgi:hypothetical protein